MKWLDAVGLGLVATVVAAVSVFVWGLIALGQDMVRREAIAAGVAEYRLDSPSNRVATFHWRTKPE